jgi:hypothetical protein
VTDGDHSGFPNFLCVVAKEIHERWQRSAIFDPTESPRRVCAYIDDRITKRADERIHSGLCVDEPKSERRDGSQIRIRGTQTCHQLGAHSLGLLGSDETHRHLAHTRIV